MYSYKEIERLCSVDERCADIVAVAAQLGRLDLVSLLLAILGVMLGIGGIYAFFNFRGIARRQAKEEAEKIASAVAEQKVNEYLQDEMPNLIEEYRRFIGTMLDDSAQADEIALAQDDGGKE